MSAPLTPEQTLRAYAKASALVGDTSRLAAACVVGADAIAAFSQPARTCGTCQHFRPWFPNGKSISGHPDGRGDCTHRRYAGRRNGQSPDDGCILGWRARETETPT